MPWPNQALQQTGAADGTSLSNVPLRPRLLSWLVMRAGMRYAKSKSRLVLAVSSGSVEGLVSVAVQLVIPRYARKLYFLGESKRGYPELERLAEEIDGFTIVRPGAEPSNLISSFRIVHQEGELIVVPGASSRFPPAEWDRVILELENAASSGDSAA